MSRIDRIREHIVGRAAKSADMWMENEDSRDLSVDRMFENGQLGRHLWRQTDGRRRQIVKRLFDLTVEDFENKL